MNKVLSKIILIILLFTTINTNAQIKTIEFISSDSLTITADLYKVNENKSTPFIILLHQAGWSRGEYIETAPKLNKLGFNCMAVDQRSGNEVNDVKNHTFTLAESKKLGVNYLDAYSDLLSAIDFVKENYADGKLIIMGSSYSAALVLHIAGQRDDIDGVMAFSPGEYFERFGKPANWIEKSAKNINVPVFITSAREEEIKWRQIYNSIKSENKQKFIPETEGNHGSRALWSKYDDSEDYWNAVTKFLKNFKLIAGK